MHELVMVFTDKIPDDAKLDEVLDPYCEYKDESEDKTLHWDFWTLGGRNSGHIKSNISSIKYNDDFKCFSYYYTGVNHKEIRSKLFDDLEPKMTKYYTDMSDENMYYGYLIDHDNIDGSIRCDGAYIRNITNDITDDGAGFIAEDGRYAERDDVDNYTELYNKVLEDYLKKDGFVTAIDIHF